MCRQQGASRQLAEACAEAAGSQAALQQLEDDLVGLAMLFDNTLVLGKAGQEMSMTCGGDCTRDEQTVGSCYMTCSTQRIADKCHDHILSVAMSSTPQLL